MLASTIRDFKLILKSLSKEPVEFNQYIKRFKPPKWSKRKTMIYINVLKEFGLIKLNSSISATEVGKNIISTILKKEKEESIFTDSFFGLLNNFKPISKTLNELKISFLLNPKISIKKLAKKTEKTRKRGIAGQYFVSILLSSFFLYNELPREEKYLELIAKSFVNSFIDRDGISCKKLFQNASDYKVNIKKIKAELLKRWRKNYRINFPKEISQILIKALEISPVNSLPFLIDLDSLDSNLIKKCVENYPLIFQYAKFSKSTDKMKLKITEDIFLEEFIITLK